MAKAKATINAELKLSFDQLIRAALLLFATGEPAKNLPPIPMILLGSTGGGKTALMKKIVGRLTEVLAKTGVVPGSWYCPAPMLMPGDGRIPDPESGSVLDNGIKTFEERYAGFLPLAGDEVGIGQVDEFDRLTSTKVANQIQRLILDGEIGSADGELRRMSQRILWILTGNGVSDKGTIAVPEAFVSRCCVLYLDDESDRARAEHAQYTIEDEWHPAIRAMQKLSPPPKREVAFPEITVRQNRTAHWASRIMKAADKVSFRTDDILAALIAGVIGQKNAAWAMSAYRNHKELPDIDGIFKNPGTAPVAKDPQIIYLTVDALVSNTDSERKAEAVLKYADRVEEAMGQAFFLVEHLDRLGQRFPKLDELPSFQKWVARHRDLFAF